MNDTDEAYPRREHRLVSKSEFENDEYSDVVATNTENKTQKKRKSQSRVKPERSKRKHKSSGLS